jgi:hypothetical protein
VTTKKEINTELRENYYHALHIAGYGDVVVNETELRDYRKDPVKFISQLISCTENEAVEYLAEPHRPFPQCSKTTKKGLRCAGEDSRYDIQGFEDWIKEKRSGHIYLCIRHRKNLS